jgi:radical SAM superfamily enzyme YgiQ (UPF0313 family)/ligand-binding sensor protein
MNKKVSCEVFSGDLSLVTRIDTLLGTKIFERMQDILPRDLGIMVGISDTSGKPITGKRRYETCIVCREHINPCLKAHAFSNYKPYSCVKERNGCDLKYTCRGGLGNPKCEESDSNAAEQAIRSNMTALYQCYFGLSNYAIPVPIGELSSIVLYGGQFTIKSANMMDEIVIEEFDEYGRKTEISEGNFREAVLEADRWRKARGAGPHLSSKEREDLLKKYREDKQISDDKKRIRVTVGRKADTWPIEKLDALLRRRYNLSVFEPWNDFLNPPKLGMEEIQEKENFLSSHYFSSIHHPVVCQAAVEALANFENRIGLFFDPERQETLNEEYREAIIPLRKVLSTIEILKELAILISRTANVTFYEDTYLTLRQTWDNHPLSIVEFYNEKWQECETRLKLLGTSDWESPSLIEESGISKESKLEEEQKRFKRLLGELTRSLMFFAYTLLSDDFHSVISMLRFNYDIVSDFREPEITHDLIEQTKICFDNIRTASAIFIEDLLVDKYELCVKKLRLAGHEQQARVLEAKRMAIRGPHLVATNKIREKLEKYYTEETTEPSELLESPKTLSHEEMQNASEWRCKVFKSLKEIFGNQSGEMKEILQDDLMLRFLYYVFVFDMTQEEIDVSQEWIEPQNELERLEVNLKWADTEMSSQIRNASTNMLEFDICQSLLQFIGRLRECVYTTRFEVLKKLAEKENEHLENTFLPQGQISCQYFVDHGIDHAKRVLENVERLIRFSQYHAERENNNIHNICESAIWQYYAKSAALFHDVGMFSEQFYKSAYGGHAAVRRCHGAFSAKRIVEEKDFALLGNDLDRRIIGQLCAYHQSSADICRLDKKLRIAASILRIADAFDICERRISGLPQRLGARRQFYDTNLASLQQCEVDELSSLQIPSFSDTQESDPEEQARKIENQIQFFNQLQSEILKVAEQQKQTNVWPVNGTCVDFVNEPPPKKEETSKFTEALKYCSEINAILEATFHYEKHQSVKDVELIHFPRKIGLEEKTREADIEIPREKIRRHYIVPVISFEKMKDQVIMQDFIVTPEYQPQVIAKVKAEFKSEIDILKPYLEQAGIRLKNPRVQQWRSSSTRVRPRNLLFINAPIATSKMKFAGAPTSLLYAIAKISNKIDRDPDFMDVNIEIFDPTCFGEREQEELRDILRDLHPRIIGISNTSAGHYNALEIAKFIRDVEDKEWKPAYEIEQLVRKGINNIEEIASKTEIYRSKVEQLMKEYSIELNAKEEEGENAYQRAIIIFGGPHENVCFDKTIEKHHDCVDISIGGIPETLIQNNGCCATQGFRTEAEDILLKIVERVLEKVKDGKQLSSLQELIEAEPPIYKSADGMFAIAYFDGTYVQKKESSRRTLDICSLPNPPRHLLQDTAKYNYGIFKNEITGEIRKTAQVITTRGCIHRCAFCSSVGTVSRRTVDDVLKELKKLQEDEYKAIFFDDSTFADECENKPVAAPYACTYTGDRCPILVKKLLEDKREEIRKLEGQVGGIKLAGQSEAEQNRKEQLLKEIKKLKNEKEDVEQKIRREGYELGKCGYAIRLCNGMVRQDMKFVWGCQTRADTVHDKLLKAMVSAGCVYVYFGIESLNQETLEKMCKGIIGGPEGIRMGAKKTRAEGLNIGLSLVFGLEGENVGRTMESLRDMLKERGAPGSRVSCVSINLATIYPGTKLEERMLARKMNYAIPDFDEKPKFDKHPFNEFEEYGWNVLPCCASESDSADSCAKKSEELAKYILKQSRAIIGERLV